MGTYLEDFAGENQEIIITVYNDDSHVQTFTLNGQNDAIIYAFMPDEEGLTLQLWSSGGTYQFGSLDTRVPNVTEAEFNEYYAGANYNVGVWSAQRYARIEKVEISGTIPVVINVQDSLARSIIPATGMIVTNVPDIGWQSRNVFATALVKNYSKIIKIYHDIYIDKPEEGASFKPPFYIHTHHNIDFSNVETNIKWGVANHGVFDVFHYNDGNYERLGTSQYDMSMLQEFTFENAIAKGYANWRLTAKDFDTKRDGVAFHFKDSFVENASLQSYESDEVVILPNGSGELIANPHPNIYVICRIFDGKPPQDVFDNSDDGDNDDDGAHDGNGGDDSDDDYSHSDDIPDGSMEGSAGIFHDIYLVSTLNIKSLHNKLWTQDYYDVLKVNENPIDNIIAAKRYPFTAPSTGSQSIRIGNIDMGISGDKLQNGVYKKPMGSCSVHEHFNNFLDYYSQNISIFLPFIGFTPLPNAEVMTAGSVGVDYLIDILSGSCKAQIYIGSELYAEREGTMGVDCTLTASTQKQSEIANSSRYLTAGLGIAGGVAAMASGNIMGGVNGLAGAAMSFANNAPENHFQSTSSNANISNAGKIQPFLIIDRAESVTGTSNPYPNNYASTVGIPCGKTCTIGTLSGYVKCGGDVTFPNGFVASDQIKNAIISAMQKGFRV